METLNRRSTPHKLAFKSVRLSHNEMKGLPCVLLRRTNKNENSHKLAVEEKQTESIGGKRVVLDHTGVCRLVRINGFYLKVWIQSLPELQR